MRATRLTLLAGFGLLFVLWGAPDAARGDAPQPARTSADVALEGLSSPVEAVRNHAVRTLVALLPGVRPRVVAALPQAAWGVQVHLLEVLAHDDSEEALKTLLRHLERTDETQAVLIRSMLLRDAGITKRLLQAYRSDPKMFLRESAREKQAVARRATLALLLQRAEIEQLFLSRKSRTGSTGYYKGQYDVLTKTGHGKSYRALALEIVTGIALDEAVPMPGVYRTGVYRFLRPHHVDEWELRGMAINAVGELATPNDLAILKRLVRRLEELQAKRERLELALTLVSRQHTYDSKEVQDALMEWDDSLGEYADVLTCMYVIYPSRSVHTRVDEFLQELQDYDYPTVPIRRYGYIAAILIRVGWYKRAIDAYDRTMFYGSKALGYYNQACAYGNWSLDKSESPGRRVFLRQRAIRALRQAVRHGWSDIGWMNEDRDLDPIRHSAEYRELVEYIRRELRPPSDVKDDGR